MRASNTPALYATASAVLVSRIFSWTSWPLLNM
jgi:hypothetical protein